MDIILSQTSNEPLYTQLYSQISSQILNGSLHPGDKLPPIREIANNLKISVIPVKMAWEELDRNGLIKTITGKGTFVAQIDKEMIQSKKNEKALLFAKEICKKAKDQNISKQELIELIEKNF